MMMANQTSSNTTSSSATSRAWKEIVQPYQQPCRLRSSWQLANTILPYAAVWALLYWSLSVSYWLAVPLVIVGGGLLVRLFIITHDCGHGSFFKSRLATDFWGFITGVLTFTPYYHWRWEHAIHHASSGDLDRRGIGDVWTMTCQEYLTAPRWKRFAYRVSRNPFVLFVLAPLVLFMVKHRFAHPKAARREKMSVFWTNLSLLVTAVAMSHLFGWKAYLILQVGIVMVAGMAGVWLFYVQHQFEDVYWERRSDWDYVEAAIKGSSYYKLPKILQWFTGNIGLHHIHHLSPSIPNYKLESCHKSDPMFQRAHTITLWSSLKCATLRLWDEEQRKLVGYRRIRQLRRQKTPTTTR
jgi:omega-6 fatty acid desaturase (delta-12 desaturase)